MDTTTSNIQPGSSGGSYVDRNETQDNVVRLLEKQRTEIMFELRRLRNKDRPVTSGGNKEAVESFFQQSDESQTTCEAPSHRPEAVIVEVQGLVERRPVSSLLQSLNFRQRLESALVGSINTTLNRISNRGSSSNSTLNSTNSPSTENINVPSPTVSTENRSLSSPPIDDVVGHSSNNVATASTTNVPATASTTNVPATARTTNVPTASVNITNTSNTPINPLNTQVPLAQNRAEEWLQHHVNNAIDNSDLPNNVLWPFTEENQRQELVSEISELVQQQLVTSSLNSSIRDNLEFHVATRVASSGADGVRVQNFIRNNVHPSRVHVRNDFSHLGIYHNVAEPMDNLDEISVISATAAVQVVQSQSNIAMAKEMQFLKMQFNELKSMMKLNFEMQLDIQRSIRQEVAAALTAKEGACCSDNCNPKRKNKPIQDDTCLICTERMTDTLIYQCGHLCVCYMCGLELKRREDHCPICRAPIKDIIRAYRSNKN